MPDSIVANINAQHQLLRCFVVAWRMFAGCLCSRAMHIANHAATSTPPKQETSENCWAISNVLSPRRSSRAAPLPSPAARRFPPPTPCCFRTYFLHTRYKPFFLEPCVCLLLDLAWWTLRCGVVAFILRVLWSTQVCQQRAGFVRNEERRTCGSSSTNLAPKRCTPLLRAWQSVFPQGWRASFGQDLT